MRWIILLAFIYFAPVAHACVEHGVLREPEYFMTRYRWAGWDKAIRMWDSPSMIKIVGTLRPGALVNVLDRTDGFLKVRLPEAYGGRPGWVGAALVEMTFHHSRDAYQVCAGAVLVTDDEDELENEQIRRTLRRRRTASR